MVYHGVYTFVPCFPRKVVYTIVFFALWPWFLWVVLVSLKDPAVLKRLRRSRSTTRSKFSLTPHWVAVFFRLENVKEERERRKTKAEKGANKKKRRNIETWKPPHLLGGGVSWPFLTIKLGIFWDCWPKPAHPLRLQPKFTIAQWFAMATPSRVYHFPGFDSSSLHTVVNMGGVVKALRSGIF